MTSQRPSRLEVFSAPILLFIHGLPRWIFPFVTATLLLMGLFVSNGVVGGTLLLVVAVIIGWLVALSWKLLFLPSRIIRTGLVLLILGYAVGRFLGRF